MKPIIGSANNRIVHVAPRRGAWIETTKRGKQNEGS